jgi:4a-hydroxytetrahydrobiopterin dehydratase
MSTPTFEELLRKKCASCEGGIPPLTGEEVALFLASAPGWEASEDRKRIRRHWVAKNFMAAIEFFDKIALLAEAEGHHPDLHLEGYRNVTVELWTHALGGLSENDFILAAKINEVPIAVRGTKSPAQAPQTS